MRNVLKWIGIALGALVVLCVVAVGVLYSTSARRLGARYAVASHPPVPVSGDSASAARGEHLTWILSCRDCHGDDLGGRIFADAGPFGLLAGPNLTTGKGGRGSSLTDTDFERAIRHGVRQDSTSLIVMPAEVYTNLTDPDFAALAAYLRHAPPVDRELAKTHLRIVGRMLLGLGNLPVLTADSAANHQHTPPVDTTSAEVHGRYLVTIAGCSGCHGPSLSGVAGGGPGGGPPSSNLTPGGLGKWTEADFVRAMREGKRPDGSTLKDAMPWRFIGKMSDGELRAVWAYLRTLPAKGYGEM